MRPAMKLRWRNYRQRFVPWLMYNWRTRQIRRTSIKDNLLTEDEILNQLRAFLHSLSLAFSSSKLNGDHRDLAAVADEVMMKAFGFTIERRTSRLPGRSGRGVFVNHGIVPAKHIVALYPGTVYMPYEPLLVQSIGNQFIFRCVDGVHIDGKDRGLSKMLYKSCVGREKVGESYTSDLSWMSSYPANPLNIGQYVNNHTRELESNVEYVEFTIPTDFPFHLRQYIPNVHYSPHTAVLDEQGIRPLRTVALVSNKPISACEELYSSYFTVVKQDLSF